MITLNEEVLIHMSDLPSFITQTTDVLYAA